MAVLLFLNNCLNSVTKYFSKGFFVINNLRKIQSFVKRSGRLTPAQKKGLTGLWDDYAIEAQGVLN
jgi:hypothetical protein